MLFLLSLVQANRGSTRFSWSSNVRSGKENQQTAVSSETETLKMGILMVFVIYLQFYSRC